MDCPQLVLCFICGNMINGSEIQNHVFKCKLSYEAQKRTKISLPEEYNLLFTTYKGGLSLSKDDLDNFNAMISSKSIQKGGQSPKKQNPQVANKINNNSQTKFSNPSPSKPMNKIDSGSSNDKILCFICGNMFPGTEIQNHVFKCKLSYEAQKKTKLTLPEEYELLFTTYKGGLSLSNEDLQNFNSLIASKSVKNTSSPRKQQNFSTTAPLKPANNPGFGGNDGYSQTMSQQRKKSPPRQAGQRPRMMVCPLCGREFGTMSLPIHMKTCRVKFEQEQQNLPKNLRRSADKIIESYNQNNANLQASGNYNMDALNDQAFDTFNKESLVPCENCGRTFLPDRLLVHLRSCKKKINK